MRLVCLGLGMALPWVAAADEPPAAPLAPKIVCDEPSYDFGERDNNGFVEHNYVVRNAGTLSLEIREVRASCGCTAVKPSVDVVPPGGEAQVQARFDLRGRTGYQQKAIFVTSNDPETPTLTLTLKGTATQPLRAEPSTIFFGQLGPDGLRSRDFEVISTRGPIQIENVRSDQAAIQVTPLPAADDADGTRHRFNVTLANDLPPGQLNGVVIIKTDLPDTPELTVSVLAFIVGPAPAP